MFFLAVTQLFGSGSAPLNFTRIPDLCRRAFPDFFPIPAKHCVDNVIVIEPLKFIFFGFAPRRAFAVLRGWDTPDLKSPPPSRRFCALGAFLDFT